MPVYEYKCKKCEHSFAITHGMLEYVETYCPICYSNELKRIFSKNFILTGTGWASKDTKSA